MQSPTDSPLVIATELESATENPLLIHKTSNGFIRC